MVSSTATSTAPLINGGSPTVFVSNMDRAVRFYTQTLGLRILFRAGDHFCMIDAGNGMQIGLHPPADNAGAPGTRGSIQIGFNVSQPIEDVYEALKQRGVKFDGPIRDDDGAVKLAFFTDPDGNDLYLCEVQH